MKKQLAILGSTGSIGTQTLEVVAEYPDLFEVYTLTANNNVDLLIEQATLSTFYYIRVLPAFIRYPEASTF